MAAPGQIIILNGAPRAGKSSIVAAIQNGFAGVWINLGVDVHASRMTPPCYRPGIGLRPGGERPDIEEFVPVLYAALYESIAAHARLGLNVVTDIGHHDAYSRPLGILADCARRLAGLPVLFVGLRCDLPTILARRRASVAGRDGDYLASAPEEPVPAPVLLWQQAVHKPGVYDLELDTGALQPDDCARAIADRLAEAPAGPTAFERLAG